MIKNVTIGTNYNLYINTSDPLDGTWWINTTAEELVILIKFYRPISSNTSVVYLYLYEENTFLELRSLFVEPQSFNPLGDVITTMGIMIMLFIGGMLVLNLVGGKRKSRW